MVDRGGAELDRQPHPLPRPELVAVQAQAEPGGAARLEHRPALLGGEGAGLAEGVDPAAARRAGGEHLAADERHVGVGVGLELGRDDVGAEEGDVVGELRRHLAGLRFRGDVEAVARLDLDVGDPGAQALGPAQLGEALELRHARGAGRLRGHPDPARLVGRAGHPRGELLGAVAGEDQVRVAVDEAGHDAAAAGVDPIVGVDPGPLDRDHLPVLEDDGGVAQLAQRPLAAQARLVGDQQADVVDRERGSPGAAVAPVVAAERRDRARSSVSTSSLTWAPSRTTNSPPTITLVTSAAVAAKTIEAAAVSGVIPARRTPSAGEVDEIGEPPAFDRPRLGPADRPLPVAPSPPRAAPPRPGCRARAARGARRARSPGPPRRGRSPPASRCRPRGARRPRAAPRRARCRRRGCARWSGRGRRSRPPRRAARGRGRSGG